MLHQVNPPEYYPLLKQVVGFEKRLLAFLCDHPAGFALAEEFPKIELRGKYGPFIKKARNFLGRKQAKWLWERIYEKEKGEFSLTAFGKSLKQALVYIEATPAAGIRILSCAENDLEFERYFQDTSYKFYERRLPAGQITSDDLKAFNPLLVGLYEKIFGGYGFPSAIHQDVSVDRLTRSKWNENFWSTNSSLGFCPACNGQKPSNISKNRSETANDSTRDVVDVARASDVDHFFPKEKYPLLSVHPDNLIPTCLECNTKAHRSYDPLMDHTTETLLDTFHSYHCPAIDHIQLSIKFKVGKKVKVLIQEHDGTRSKRIENLVRVFDLETRWADWLEGFTNSTYEAIQTTHPTNKTKDMVRDWLLEDLKNCVRYRSTRDKCFIYAGFLNYLLSDPQEFESFCATFGL